MNPKLYRLVACLIFTLACLEPTLSCAGGNKTKKPEPPSRGIVSAVDIANKTITLSVSPKATPQTLTYSSTSTLEIGGKSSNFDQVRIGMQVRSIHLTSDTPPSIEDLDLVRK